MPRDILQKVLIANRGEIACRLVRAAKRLRLQTVAVYSTPDALAPHVLLADEAVHIGPAAAAASYLNGARIIEAARRTGARAVHPGYGFLSENSAFVKHVENAGVTFVGPPASAIESMGDKLLSKRIAASSGVNVIPGFVGEIVNEEQAIEEGRKITYPVMVKASAGGGGKGMRVAHTDDEMRTAFRLSKAEAMKAFGDDRMLIEKYIECPRHIEIQIIADKLGNIVHLGERECSIQRRNQKIIEESPSPFVDDALRRKMGEQAIALARAVNYSSAGTVECLVSGVDGSFYFLEMNTRLQVEHPVTEAVTGYDLAELMFRIAAGEKLPFSQDDVTQSGWSVEARVYAENPFRGFLPSSGTIFGYLEPSNARVDSGVVDGSVIESYYDPILSKVVTHGESRDVAIDKLQIAMDKYVINGIQTNLSFLRAITDSKRFRSGLLSTHFIDEEYPDGFEAGVALQRDEMAEVLAMTGKLYFEKHASADPASRQSGRLERPPHRVSFDVLNLNSDLLSTGEVEYSDTTCGGSSADEQHRHGDISVKCEFRSHDSPSSTTDGQRLPRSEDGGNARIERKFKIRAWRHDILNGGDAAMVESVIARQIDGSTQFGDEQTCILTRIGPTPYAGIGKWTVCYHGAMLQVRMAQLNENMLAHKLGGWDAITREKSNKYGDNSRNGELRAPMTGNIVSVAVQVGDPVVEGQEVVVIEAMKMQNSVRSEVSGVVSEVRVLPNVAVGLDDVLVRINVTATEAKK